MVDDRYGRIIGRRLERGKATPLEQSPTGVLEILAKDVKAADVEEYNNLRMTGGNMAKLFARLPELCIQARAILDHRKAQEKPTPVPTAVKGFGNSLAQSGLPKQPSKKTTRRPAKMTPSRVARRAKIVTKQHPPVLIDIDLQSGWVDFGGIKFGICAEPIRR